MQERDDACAMRVGRVSAKRSYLRLSGVNKVEQQMDNASHSKQWHGAERTSRSAKEGDDDDNERNEEDEMV